jgi:hypothetical protein
MDNSESPDWDQLSATLLARDLPKAYVRRVVDELQDHAEDIRDDGGEINWASLIGDIDVLADAISDQTETWAIISRYPVVSTIIVCLWAAYGFAALRIYHGSVASSYQLGAVIGELFGAGLGLALTFEFFQMGVRAQLKRIARSSEQGASS